MAFGDKPQNQDPQTMANSLAMMQAAIAMHNANQRGGNISDMFMNGAAGYMGGLGMAQRYNEERDARNTLSRAREMETQIKMANHVKEMQNQKAREDYINSLPPEQRALALAAGDKFFSQAAEHAFAPQKSYMSIVEHMGKNGLVFNPNTQSYELVPGYAAAQASLEGGKAYARGMNTPVVTTPGGNVVVPSLAAQGNSSSAGGYVPPVAQLFIDSAARDSGVDPNMIAAMAYVESGFDNAARSRKGAYGPMQLMPDTAKEYGVDPRDPVQNYRGGARMYADMLRKYQDPQLALAAYNWGPGNLDRWLSSGADPAGMPKETRDYVSKVMSRVSGGNVSGGNVSGVIYQDDRPVPGVQEKAESQEWGKSLVRQAEQVIEQGDAARNVLNNLEIARNVPIQTGQTVPITSYLGRWAESLGIDPSLFSVNNPSNVEVVNKALQSVVNTELRAEKGPQTDSDVKRFKEAMANIKDPQEAYNFMLDVSIRVQERKIARQAFYEEYRMDKGTFEGAARAWRKWEKENPLDLAFRPASGAGGNARAEEADALIREALGG